MEPTADATISLVDYDFQIAPAITAGQKTIRIENHAAQDHEVVLVQLAPGKSIQDFVNWTNTMSGPPPGRPMSGIAGMAPGRHAFVSDNFTPGDYGLVCFVPDMKDEKPHFMHGMMKQFTVQ